MPAVARSSAESRPWVVEPGWVDVIDLERLDLCSFRWCVGGQIEASYHGADRKGRYVRARYADFARRHDLVNNPDILACFNADHPFLFFIRDNKTGSVLFTGRLENPKA